MEKKKKALICLSSIAIILIIGLIIFIISYSRMPEPLSGYDFANCEVSVYDLGVTSTKIIAKLDESGEEILFEILDKAKISKFGTYNYPALSGGSGLQFKLDLKDGKSLEIAEYGNYLLVDGKEYRCDKESLSKLDELQREASLNNHGYRV